MRDENNNPELSGEEKAELKREILDSIEALRSRRKVYVQLSIAASLIILMAASVFLYTQHDNEQWVRGDMAMALDQQVSFGDAVVLLLSDSESIVIEESEPVISYSSNGSSIRINESQNITQSDLSESTYNTLLVPYGKRSQVTLSDGTRVWLNSGTKLVYPGRFQGKTREVYVEGEAIFEVARNTQQPFLIKAQQHEIRVLGTVFSVSNYPDESSIQTVLKSGKVQVAYTSTGLFGNTASIDLEPGTMASYNRHSFEMETSMVNVEFYFSWRDGVLVFKNDDLESIMRKLSRYYNVEIQIADETIKTERFSGYLDLRDDIGQVITTIEETSNFRHTRDGDKKIIIYEN